MPRAPFVITSWAISILERRELTAVGKHEVVHHPYWAVLRVGVSKLMNCEILTKIHPSR